MPETTSPKTVYWPASDGCGCEADEELRPGAVHAGGPAHGRHRAANEGPVRELGLQQTEAARPVLRGLGRVLRERIAALDDPAHDDAVEGRAVVAAGLRRLHEERRVLRRDLGQQPDREAALRRLDHGLGARSHRGSRRGRGFATAGLRGSLPIDADRRPRHEQALGTTATYSRTTTEEPTISGTATDADAWTHGGHSLAPIFHSPSIIGWRSSIRRITSARSPRVVVPTPSTAHEAAQAAKAAASSGSHALLVAHEEGRGEDVAGAGRVLLGARQRRHVVDAVARQQRERRASRA